MYVLKTKTCFNEHVLLDVRCLRNVISCKLAFSDKCCNDSYCTGQWSEFSGQCSENTHQKGTYHFIFLPCIVDNQFTTLTNKIQCSSFRYLYISITISIATCFSLQVIPVDDPSWTETCVNSQLIL